MDDLQLAGGFAREVEDAFEMAGAQLAEGELEQHPGLAETGRRLEEDRGVFSNTAVSSVRVVS